MRVKKRRDAGRPRGEPIVDAVLARTLEELSSFGIDGLSVDRIARQADVNKTSVYRRWPTKEALISAALERGLVDVAARVPDTGSLRGDLLGLLAPVSALRGRGKSGGAASIHSSSSSCWSGRACTAPSSSTKRSRRSGSATSSTSCSWARTRASACSRSGSRCGERDQEPGTGVGASSRVPSKASAA